MSWLISLFLAGVVFTTDTTIPQQKIYNYTSNETNKVIRLDETERFEQTYPLNSNGRVSVSNVNGSVTIDTWDRNEVKLEAVKVADSKERLSEVEIKIDARPDAITVETDYDSWKRENRGWKNYGKLTVDYRLTVPRNATLNEIETVNGSVTITNSQNVTKASTVNGQVTAVNLRGTANLSTVNGTVEANFDQLQAGGKISLDTVNGQVNLTIPSDANATVKADTVNGNINNDFGLPVRKGQYVGRDLYGKIGSGDVQIRLNSVNGALNIRRKSDGKNVNPAVNLLPPKSSNDDWDNDDQSFVAPKLNMELSKAQKEMENAQKDIQKSMKEAQKEIEKMQPEIEKITEESVREATEAIRKSVKDQTSLEFKRRMKEAQTRQKEAMVRIAEARFFPGAPVIEKKSESFPVKGTPKITVDAKGCDVSVKGWDKPEVQYFVTRISRNRNLRPLDLKTDHQDSAVDIKVVNHTPRTDYGADSNRVRVEVFVPKKSNLRILSDREIRLENVSGDIDLTGVSESINVRDADGKLIVASADGKIRVVGFKGEIQAKTVEGEMSLEGDFQKFSAQAECGTIILTLPDGANINVEANTKDIQAEGFPFVFVSENEETDISLFKIGKGGEKFRFNVADGQIFIRSANALRASY